MRAFFALPLPEAARKALGVWMEAHPVLPWGRLDNLHLTMAFLGDVTPETAEAARACGAATASRHGALTLATSKLGTFPKAHGAPILFLELAPNAALQALAMDLRRALAEAGVPFDAKPFHPHLTLARPRTRIPLPEPPPIQTWTADRLRLLESLPEAGGVQYRECAAWGLDATAEG